MMEHSDVMHCPVCDSKHVSFFLELRQIPVHCNLLHRTREEAMNARRGDMRLGFCHACGHVYNYSFDPSLMTYSQAYENSLHFSPRFQRYAMELANDLVGRYNLQNKTVIEIGCGQGDFLNLLCSLGNNRGIGFDESYVPPERSDDETFTVIRDFFSQEYSHYNPDFVCCRHVLEHIPAPVEFVRNIRKSVGHQCKLYFEVPNALCTLKDLAIWDLIYEHCSYFTQNSLAQLFGACGFNILRLGEKYCGQFLGIELAPSGNAGYPRVPQMEAADLASGFATTYHQNVGAWKKAFEQLRSESKRTVVWGSGSKGVTFLNTLKTNVEYIVDLNTRKQGMYVAGTGQQIVPPQFLCEYKPDTIIIMNSIYEEEIRQTLREMGLSPALLVA
jgi:2-polyprenyl-3-methyl-5-hydroxy-6-metoxy-1,4-benzoquinol methylase